MPNFGWRKDKYDKRDFLHEITAEVSEKYSLEPWACNPRDQGNEGSCTGFGIAGQVTSVAKKAQVHPKEWFSPRDIYNGIRFIEGTLLSDDGGEARDGYKWIAAKGLIWDHCWPYVDTPLDTRARPSRLDAHAGLWLPIKYLRVTGGVSGICNALGSGNFVSLGSPWYANWMEIGPDGVLPPVGRAAMVGGHETFLFAYDKMAQIFQGQNSWGLRWGRGGRFVMPFSAIDNFLKDGGFDSYYIQANWPPSITTWARV